MSPDRASAKPEEFGYCGVNCSDCDIFKATVHGDAEALQRAHKRWTKTAQEHWGMQTLDPAILKCRGCRTEGADIFKGCRHCPMRRCAKSRNLPSCGLCQEWKTCKQLGYVLAVEPAARATLERIEVSSSR